MSLKEAVELHGANTAKKQVSVDGVQVTLAHTKTKTLRMRITRDGDVKVSVPAWLTFDKAKELVEDNIDWAKKKLAAQTERQGKPSPLTETDHVRLWGEDVPFKLVRESTRSRLKTEYNETGFVILAPTDVTEDALKAALDKLLAKELGTHVASLAPKLEARVGKHAAKWRFRRMVSRWGSCNVKTASITLNVALAELDPKFLEYVMCHELCHLWEKGHNGRFYARLADACPDWARLRYELRNSVV